MRVRGRLERLEGRQGFVDAGGDGYEQIHVFKRGKVENVVNEMVRFRISSDLERIAMHPIERNAETGHSRDEAIRFERFDMLSFRFDH